MNSDFNNASPLHNLRFWFIRLIAGKMVVLINARIRIDPRVGDRTVQLRGLNGGMFEHCSFEVPGNLMLEIGPRT